MAVGRTRMMAPGLIPSSQCAAKAVKVAEGGMHYERLRIQNAQNQLAKATKPEERQAAQNEIAAAQKAGQIASKKYFRGKGLLNNVRVKMGKPAQP